jgi:RHS repeat-associated protein
MYSKSRPELHKTYDALGNKVEENANGTINEHVPAFGISAQMSGQTEASTLVALPGGVQALYSGGTLQRFRYPDWQGTIRAESDATTSTFTESLAFAPFGERYAVSGTPYNTDSFTGQPDQIASDEYDFAARELHDGQGRWISPDPMSGTGNKYMYANNNPLMYVDLLGLSPSGTTMADNSTGMESPDDDEEAMAESRAAPAIQTDGVFAPFAEETNAYLDRLNNPEIEIVVVSPPAQKDPTPDPSPADIAKVGAQQQNNGQRLVSISGTEDLALKPLVEHYIVGRGTDYTLSDDAFNKFISEMQKDGRLNGDQTAVAGMPDGVTQQQVNTYGTSYALAVGSTTVYYLNGKPAGYRDYWDFDSKSWGQRPAKAEIETRAAGGVLNNVMDGRPFWVEYGIHPH